MFVLVLKTLRNKHVLFRHRVRFGSEGFRLIMVWVNVDVQVFQLSGNVLLVRRVHNFPRFLVLHGLLVDREMLVNVDVVGLSELWQHHFELRVVRPVMHNQVLLQNVLAQLVLGNHALHSSVDDLVGVFFEQFSHVVLFQTAEVLSVVSIEFEVLLLPRNIQVLGVHNHTDVATLVFLCVVDGLVLAANEDSAHAGHPAERDSFRVKQMVSFAFVLNRNVARLGFFLRHDLLQASVEKVGVHFVDSVANVRVERPRREFGLWDEFFVAIDHSSLPFIFHTVIPFLTSEGIELKLSSLIKISFSLLTLSRKERTLHTHQAKAVRQEQHLPLK